MEELAQDGRGISRATQSLKEFLCRLAARIRAFLRSPRTPARGIHEIHGIRVFHGSETAVRRHLNRIFNHLQMAMVLLFPPTRRNSDL